MSAKRHYKQGEILGPYCKDTAKAEKLEWMPNVAITTNLTVANLIGMWQSFKKVYRVISDIKPGEQFILHQMLDDMRPEFNDDNSQSDSQIEADDQEKSKNVLTESNKKASREYRKGTIFGPFYDYDAFRKQGLQWMESIPKTVNPAAVNLEVIWVSGKLAYKATRNIKREERFMLGDLEHEDKNVSNSAKYSFDNDVTEITKKLHIRLSDDENETDAERICEVKKKWKRIVKDEKSASSEESGDQNSESESDKMAISRAKEKLASSEDNKNRRKYIIEPCAEPICKVKRKPINVGDEEIFISSEEGIDQDKSFNYSESKARPIREARRKSKPVLSDAISFSSEEEANKSESNYSLESDAGDTEDDWKPIRKSFKQPASKESFPPRNHNERIHNRVSVMLHNCKHCTKNFVHKISLQKHVKDRHPGKHFKMEKKSIVVNKKSSEKIEGSKENTEARKAQGEISENGMYVCKECGKEFKWEMSLTDHIAIHNQDYKCKKCGKCFGKQIYLNQHIISHKTEKQIKNVKEKKKKYATSSKNNEDETRNVTRKEVEKLSKSYSKHSEAEEKEDVKQLPSKKKRIPKRNSTVSINSEKDKKYAGQPLHRKRGLKQYRESYVNSESENKNVVKQLSIKRKLQHENGYSTDEERAVAKQLPSKKDRKPKRKDSPMSSYSEDEEKPSSNERRKSRLESSMSNHSAEKLEPINNRGRKPRQNLSNYFSDEKKGAIKKKFRPKRESLVIFADEEEVKIKQESIKKGRKPKRENPMSCYSTNNTIKHEPSKKVKRPRKETISRRERRRISFADEKRVTLKQVSKKSTNLRHENCVQSEMVQKKRKKKSEVEKLFLKCNEKQLQVNLIRMEVSPSFTGLSSKDESESESESESDEHKCSVCSKIFFKENIWLKHMQKHDAQGEF